MRKLFGAMALAAILVAPSTLMAQRPFHLGAQGNFETDNSKFGVGVRYENELNKIIHVPGLRAVASFDYFFPGSNVTYWEINAGAAYSINMPAAPVKPYVGAGLNYAHASVSVAGFGGSSSDVGLNLFGGVRLKPMGNLTPFAEARFELGGGDNIVITAGLMFF